MMFRPNDTSRISRQPPTESTTVTGSLAISEVSSIACAASRSTILERRDLAVTSEVDLGDGRRLIRGTREVGGVPCGYLLVLVRGADYVHSFEAWGPETVFAPAFEALVTSARGLTR